MWEQKYPHAFAVRGLVVKNSERKSRTHPDKTHRGHGGSLRRRKGRQGGRGSMALGGQVWCSGKTDRGRRGCERSVASPLISPRITHRLAHANLCVLTGACWAGA